MARFLTLGVVLGVLLTLAPGARGAVVVYTANLNGPSESPPNASPGFGFAEVDFDAAAQTMRVQVTFADLLGTTAASHIHGPTALPGFGNAGVATTIPTFTDFPLGVTSGSYDHLFDLTLPSSYNPAFVTAHGGTVAGAEAALAAALADGEAYLNIHTNVFLGGEIRGFLTPVPEPSAVITWSSLSALGVGLGWRHRKRAA